MIETKTVKNKICDLCMRTVDNFYSKDNCGILKDHLEYVDYDKYDLCFECHNKILRFLNVEFPITNGIDQIEIVYKKRV
jgi:hypothetical protein